MHALTGFNERSTMFTPDEEEHYRTCADCGRACEPVPFEIIEAGLRLAFICPVHGVHTVVDPFEADR